MGGVSPPERILPLEKGSPVVFTTRISRTRTGVDSKFSPTFNVESDRYFDTLKIGKIKVAKDVQVPQEPLHFP